MTPLSRFEKRDRFLDACRNRTMTMGILNVTPDSFSDGGRFDAHEKAIAQAKRMVEAGCGIIDIGGESTRPGSEPVSEAEERQRVSSVIRELCNTLDTPVSIDTYKAAIAQEAADLGASVINDVWGLRRDPEMARTVAETESAVVVMHNRKETDPATDILEDMKRFFDHSIAMAEENGIPHGHLIFDPGIGFGKTFEQNLTCIRHLDIFDAWEVPVLLGLSRKSVIGGILGNKVDERLTGTLVANTIGVTKGASILRVHDVEEHEQALSVLRALGISK